MKLAAPGTNSSFNLNPELSQCLSFIYYSVWVQHEAIIKYPVAEKLETIKTFPSISQALQL